MVKKIVSYFDKLEDRIRFRLSRKPIIYAIIGAVGVALLWKGVDDIALRFGINGFLAIGIGLVMLMATGLLVSFFIGDSIILSGFKKEKKLVEKTGEEVAFEKETLGYVVSELERIEEQLDEIQQENEKHHPQRRIPL